MHQILGNTLLPVNEPIGVAPARPVTAEEKMRRAAAAERHRLPSKNRVDELCDKIAAETKSPTAPKADIDAIVRQAVQEALSHRYQAAESTAALSPEAEAERQRAREVLRACEAAGRPEDAAKLFFEGVTADEIEPAKQSDELPPIARGGNVGTDTI